MNNENDDKWLEIIAKSLSLIALNNITNLDKDLAAQGLFLERLGLSRKDSAELLGTTAASLTELISRNNRKKGKLNNASKRKKFS